jgi:2-keto-4-pentenoate hydratase/2-oxohepta-3-ene-1,7-dioic acid hydratase in catechol pathway
MRQPRPGRSNREVPCANEARHVRDQWANRWAAAARCCARFATDRRCDHSIRNIPRPADGRANTAGARALAHSSRPDRFLKAQHKGRDAAEQAIAFARSLSADSRGIDNARVTFAQDEVKLLAPLPRPNSLRDFSIFEEHMTRREGGAVLKRPSWYRWPRYYKGNPDAIIGPEDPIPYPSYSDKLDLELEIGIIVGMAAATCHSRKRKKRSRATRS